ncbi:hypothetical protein U9M48_043012 [Paspalum notatum var. saurae]|uniref:Integrase catalytic domain-containing protein n=1 Tax=Paspalum notatum var. saurae TaxID=547442 RepID=A0AAQ3XGP2_PASNO
MTNHTLTNRIPRWWLHIDFLTQLNMKEGILDIKLRDRPLTNRGHGKKSAKSGHMSKRSECLIIITTMFLLKTTCNKTIRKSKLYVLHLQVGKPVYLATIRNNNAWHWHERLGHVNFGALEKMSKFQMARGLPQLEHVEQFCDTCVIAKHQRGAFPKKAVFRGEKSLELIHDDLCGPVSPTPGGRRFFLLLVDDVTRYMWVVLLEAKPGAGEAIKRMQAEAERQSRRLLRVLRTDNGGEFTAKEFANYCSTEGIKRHFFSPYTP